MCIQIYAIRTNTKQIVWATAIGGSAILIATDNSRIIRRQASSHIKAN